MRGLVESRFSLADITDRDVFKRLGERLANDAQEKPRVQYQVDGWHPGHGVLLEVEAGRGARGNAVFRDLIRTALITDAEYLALGVMRSYRHRSGGKEVRVESYQDTIGTLDALYESRRVTLPFAGILVFGY